MYTCSWMQLFKTENRFFSPINQDKKRQAGKGWSANLFKESAKAESSLCSYKYELIIFFSSTSWGKTYFSYEERRGQNTSQLGKSSHGLRCFSVGIWCHCDLSVWEKKTETKKDFMWLTVSVNPGPQPEESVMPQQHSEHNRLGKRVRKGSGLREAPKSWPWVTSFSWTKTPETSQIILCWLGFFFPSTWHKLKHSGKRNLDWENAPIRWG